MSKTYTQVSKFPTFKFSGVHRVEYPGREWWCSWLEGVSIHWADKHNCTLPESRLRVFLMALRLPHTGQSQDYETADAAVHFLRLCRSFKIDERPDYLNAPPLNGFSLGKYFVDKEIKGSRFCDDPLRVKDYMSPALLSQLDRKIIAQIEEISLKHTVSLREFISGFIFFYCELIASHRPST